MKRNYTAEWLFRVATAMAVVGLLSTVAYAQEPWKTLAWAVVLTAGISSQVYTFFKTKADLAEDRFEQMRRVMHDANAPYRYAVEKELRQREVYHVYFAPEGEVTVTTHAVGQWHQHGEGRSLHDALMELDHMLTLSPRPPGRITTGEVQT